MLSDKARPELIVEIPWKVFDRDLLLKPGAAQEGESLAALIPDRDTLVPTPVPDDGDWGAPAKLAKNADGDPLWTEPLVVTSTGVSAVEW